MAEEIGVGTVLSGRYRLEEPLGGGGFGQVYAALDMSLGRRVAVKVLTLRAEWDEGERTERLGRFRREAHAAAALDHPNVARVHAAGEHGGRPYLVMELLAGQDLGQVLLDRGGLPVADVLAYGAQIAAGLQHAHEHGLVHRDIKPENLMLLADGTVRICDFGLVVQRDPAQTRYTAQHAVLGSPPYLSPEQARGREVTERSDLYSLGCVLYALLAEGPPFSAQNAFEYAYAHAHETPERIESRRPDVPGDLAHLVHGLLAKEPGERPVSADDVARQTAWRCAPSVPDAAHSCDAGPRCAADGVGAAGGGRGNARGREVHRRGPPLLGRPSSGSRAKVSRRASASFAAHFGRVRALEGMHGVPAVLGRLEDLAADVRAALGAGHPLTRCVASYTALRAAPAR